MPLPPVAGAVPLEPALAFEPPLVLEPQSNAARPDAIAKTTSGLKVLDLRIQLRTLLCFMFGVLHSREHGPTRLGPTGTWLDSIADAPRA
jgi:hypothetical protein